MFDSPYDRDAAETQADALTHDANAALHDWDGVFYIDVDLVGEYSPHYAFNLWQAKDYNYGLLAPLMSSWDAFTLADASSVISDLDAMFRADLVTLDGLRRILGVQADPEVLS